MVILDAGDVAPQKSGALFYVALTEFLLFAKFAESIADDHGGGIIALNRPEGKVGQAESLAASFLEESSPDFIFILIDTCALDQ